MIPLHEIFSKGSKAFFSSSCTCDQKARQTIVNPVASKGSSKLRQVHSHSRCWIVTGSHGFHKVAAARSDVAFAHISSEMMMQRIEHITLTTHFRIKQPHQGTIYFMPQLKAEEPMAHFQH